MLSHKGHMETLNLISIQHELAMNIGLSPALRPMVRKFMKVCLRRLDLRRINLCLTDGGEVASPQDTEPSGTGPLWIAMPQAGGPPAACSQMEKIMGRLLENDPDEHHIKTIRQGDLYLYLYPIQGLGGIVFERAGSSLPAHLLHALIPIVKRL